MEVVFSCETTYSGDVEVGHFLLRFVANSWSLLLCYWLPCVYVVGMQDFKPTLFFVAARTGSENWCHHVHARASKEQGQAGICRSGYTRWRTHSAQSPLLCKQGNLVVLVRLCRRLNCLLVKCSANLVCKIQFSKYCGEIEETCEGMRGAHEVRIYSI